MRVVLMGTIVLSARNEEKTPPPPDRAVNSNLFKSFLSASGAGKSSVT